MDAISDPQIRQVVVMSSSQVGKTELLLNAIGYYCEHDAAPIMVVQPTLSMAQSFSKDRLAPMFRDSPSLKNKIQDPRSRDSGNTTLHKIFPGGHVTIAGANRAAGLASRPIRIVLADEIDRYPSSSGTEGDPIALASRRSQTFWNGKLVTVSTPTIKDSSRIEAEYEYSDKRTFFCRCPHCDEPNTLKWSNVKWEDSDAKTANYCCEDCGVAWSESDRQKSIKAGQWIASAETNGIAGFHLSGLYSPWLTIENAVRDFLEAKKLPETLQVWVNTYLAEAWDTDRGGEGGDLDVISGRVEHYRAIIPEQVEILTAGVDVQGDRLECEILGHRQDGSQETWSISYHVIQGDPSGREVWAKLDQILLEQDYLKENGEKLKISCTCIDSGGSYTQSVYDYVRPREKKRIFAIKGMAGEGRPLVGRPSRNNIGKIRLYAVGVDTAKELIMARLKIEEAGPGFCHFPDSYSEEYFAQLTSERAYVNFSKGFRKRSWKKIRRRNEALDCRVYNLCAFALLGGYNGPKQILKAVPRKQPKNFATDW